MKAELLKLLEPINEQFIGNLLKIEDDRKKLNDDLAREITKTQQEQQNLKIQIVENNKKLELAKDALAAEKMHQTGLNNQIKDEIARYSKLSKEFEGKLLEIEQNLKNSRVERDMVAEALSRAKKQEDDYKAKTETLKTDFAKSDALKKELAEKEKDLSARSKALEKQQTENITKANELNDIDLSLKAREKEVNRLIARYELERFIKKEK